MNPEENKILLLEHRADYRAIYGLNLKVYLGAQVTVASTIKEAMNAHAADPHALVFVDARAYSTDIAQDLFAEFQKSRLSVPFFIIGDTAIPQTEATIFDGSIAMKEILQSIAKTLSVTAKEMASLEVGEYYPLPMEFIVPGWNCETEVYRQVGEDFQVIFETDDIILQDTLEELELEGELRLFVQAKRRIRFINSLTTQISAKLKDPNLTPEDRMKTTAKGYQMVMEQARKVGISETTLNIANECIASMNDMVEGSPNLSILLKDLTASKSSYRYKHSLLISYIGSHIINRMDWGSKEQQQKLSYVSFFHDIALTRDEYARLRSDEEVDQLAVSAEQKHLIKNHAILAAKAVTNIEKLPFGADTIIKQHHGCKNGNSLSNLSMGISPLAIVFIFAEEWTDMVLDYEDRKETPDKAVILAKLEAKYDIPAFRKILPALRTLEI